MEANDSREANSSTGENENVNETKMQQPPIVILPLIFSKLAFNDIQSCRLVNRQWHRHALGSVNLVLYVEDYGPTRSHVWIPERHGVYSPREIVSLDRFHCRLVPCTRFYLPKDAPESKRFFFQEINDGVNSFKQRIKKIQLQFKGSNERMHPVLQTFIANFPAAKRVDGRCDELGVCCTFEEDKSAAGLDNRAAAMKLRQLQLGAENPGDVTATASIIAPFIQQAANEAASIDIYGIQQFQSLLNELERKSVDAPIIFDTCINVTMKFKEGANQFDINRFPNIHEVTIIDKSNLANANFMASLEQILNLKHLTIESRFREELQLPSLRLPNLVHLELYRTNLPINPLQFDSPRLEELEIAGGVLVVDENLRRLAKYARNGGCKSLKTLKFNEIDTDSVSRHLPAILKVAKGLQALSITGIRGHRFGFQLIAETCIKVAAAAPRNLAELKFEHEVPVAVGAKQFVRELVAWHQLVGLKAPLVIAFTIDEDSDLANGLEKMLRQSKEIDVDGTHVTLAVLKAGPFQINFEMVWRNNVNGTLQILRPRIRIPPHLYEDED